MSKWERLRKAVNNAIHIGPSWASAGKAWNSSDKSPGGLYTRSDEGQRRVTDGIRRFHENKRKANK